MRAVRLLTGVASLPLLPVVAARAALDAPRAAADHPSSRELRQLLDAGFAVTDYRHHRDLVSAHVSLQRGDETREVASSDLAFAAYAARAAPRAVARASRRYQRQTLRAPVS